MLHEQARRRDINLFTQDPAEVQRVIEWLNTVKFEAPVGRPTIEGVHVRELKAHVDGRGDVVELWSTGWQDYQANGGWVLPTTHAYQSATDRGVIKAWHLHREHTDQFTTTRGKIQVVIADARPESPTFGQVNSFVFGIQRPLMVQIPPGTLHGWKALSEETIIVNFQTHVYDAKDEFKFDPALVTSLANVWEPKNG